jgi:hypothetical protein
VETKVFCIGFHKTGTTSLAEALKVLGYRVTGPNGVKDPNIAENVLSMAYSLVDKYDAFQDNPWPIIYKELDSRYPDSKFILTVRDAGSWIRSQTRHFGYDETPMRQWIYGVASPMGNEDIYVRRFERHNQEVKEYFKERQGQLLILDLAKGDAWAHLCPFLGVSVPAMRFPHANRAEERERDHSLGARVMRRAKNLARRLSRRLMLLP